MSRCSLSALASFGVGRRRAGFGLARVLLRTLVRAVSEAELVRGHVSGRESAKRMWLSIADASSGGCGRCRARPVRCATLRHGRSDERRVNTSARRCRPRPCAPGLGGGLPPFAAHSWIGVAFAATPADRRGSTTVATSTFLGARGLFFVARPFCSGIRRVSFR